MLQLSIVPRPKNLYPFGIMTLNKNKYNTKVFGYVQPHFYLYESHIYNCFSVFSLSLTQNFPNPFYPFFRQTMAFYLHQIPVNSSPLLPSPLFPNYCHWPGLSFPKNFLPLCSLLSSQTEAIMDQIGSTKRSKVGAFRCHCTTQDTPELIMRPCKNGNLIAWLGRMGCSSLRCWREKENYAWELFSSPVRLLVYISLKDAILSFLASLLVWAN